MEIDTDLLTTELNDLLDKQDEAPIIEWIEACIIKLKQVYSSNDSRLMALMGLKLTADTQLIHAPNVIDGVKTKWKARQIIEGVIKDLKEYQEIKKKSTSATQQKFVPGKILAETVHKKTEFVNSDKVAKENDNNDKKKFTMPFNISKELGWTIAVAIIGGAFYLGFSIGGTKFDKDKIDLYNDNKVLKEDTSRLNVKIRNQEIILLNNDTLLKLKSDSIIMLYSTLGYMNRKLEDKSSTGEVKK